MAAENLESGDILLSTEGELYVVSVENIVLDSTIVVYNLNVRENHNYFVCESSVLVHNKCGLDNKRISQKFDDKYGYVRIDLERGGSGQYNLHLHKDNMKYWFDGISGFEGAGKINRTSFVKEGVKKALEFLSKIGGSL